MNYKSNNAGVQWIILLIAFWGFLFGNPLAYGDDEEADKESETFSLSAASTTDVPPNILQEIAFFQGGNGLPPCVELRLTSIPNWGNQVTRYGDDEWWGVGLEPRDSFEIMEGILIYTCGHFWEDQEQLKFTVKYPNGRSISGKVVTFGYEHAEYGGFVAEASFGFETELNDPSGKYTLLIEGKNKTIRTHFYIISPIGPRFTLMQGVRMRKEPMEILLYNFHPNERVRLLAYARQNEPTFFIAPSYGAYTLTHWQEFQVNSRGQLKIHISESDSERIGLFGVIGDISGEAAMAGGFYLGIADNAAIQLLRVRTQIMTKQRTNTLTIEFALQLYLKFFDKCPQIIYREKGSGDLIQIIVEHFLQHPEALTNREIIMAIAHVAEKVPEFSKKWARCSYRIGRWLVRQGHMENAAFILDVPSVVGIGSVSTRQTALNIRNGKGTNYDVIAKAQRGEEVFIVDDAEPWYRVQLQNGIVGYAHSDYIENLEEENWFVISGSFQQKLGRAKPENLVKGLKEHGFDAYIINTDKYSNLANDLWAVVLGPYSEQKNAKEMKSLVMPIVHDAYIKLGGAVKSDDASKLSDLLDSLWNFQDLNR